MTEEETFLRAICADPDDDTPRLVFADWLDERGGVPNEEWAELIRVQVQLGRNPGADRERLAARDQELEANVMHWWPDRIGLPHPVASFLGWGNWSRGFPLSVSGFGGNIVKARPFFAGRVPVRELVFKGVWDDHLREVVTWPELELVRRLDVWTEGAPLSEAAFLALCGCEYLCNLERLRIEMVEYTDAGVEAFLDSPHLRNLVSVQIDGYGFDELSEELRQRVHGRFGEWDVR
jgi:uncharacterized protein (TIGR02996 family)